MTSDPTQHDLVEIGPPKPKRTRRTTAMVVAGGVLVVGAGLGAATFAQADPTTSPTPGAPSASASAQPGPGGKGGPGREGRGGHGPHGGQFGADFVKQLASKLGVTEAKLTEALKAIREENRANKPSADPSASPSASPSTPTRPDPAEREAALAKALASKLGIDEAKVKAALDELKAARNAEQAAALKTRLDAAVKAGTLTQAEADAVTKAVEKGVINPGPR